MAQRPEGFSSTERLWLPLLWLERAGMMLCACKGGTALIRPKGQGHKKYFQALKSNGICHAGF